MTTVCPFLTFTGNCREAMSFYRECLGGELHFQTIGESPLSEGMPAEMKSSILHATLINEELVILASDIVGENGLTHGNANSLLLDCSSENEIREYYRKLSADGQKTHALENTFWGALFGGLIDKFGNHWLLNYNSMGTVRSRKKLKENKQI